VNRQLNNEEQKYKTEKTNERQGGKEWAKEDEYG
jgi:hypothetical protein